MSSSSLRVEQRTVPRPPQPVTRPQQRVQPQPESRTQRIARQAPAVTRHLRTPRTTPLPSASPVPRTTSLQEQLAQQERAFERQAQAMREARAPLSLATIEPQQSATFRRTLVDSEGVQKTSAQAVLVPLPGKHWIADGLSCYYVHYYASYSTGGSEEGNIPWPLCYPADHDAMLPLDRRHELPIPVPPPGFQLPPGTAMGPLLTAIYEHRLPGER